MSLGIPHQILYFAKVFPLFYPARIGPLCPDQWLRVPGPWIEGHTLTFICESWKQNPKPGNVIQRHLWKQHPDKIQNFDFGNVTQRHFWKQNPEHFHEHLLINFIFKIFWERHPASFLETKST